MVNLNRLKEKIDKCTVHKGNRRVYPKKLKHSILKVVKKSSIKEVSAQLNISRSLISNWKRKLSVTSNNDSKFKIDNDVSTNPTLIEIPSLVANDIPINSTGGRDNDYLYKIILPDGKSLSINNSSINLNDVLDSFLGRC